jgi:hypothetical protein
LDLDMQQQLLGHHVEDLKNNSTEYRASCKTPIMLNNFLFHARNLVVL